MSQQSRRRQLRKTSTQRLFTHNLTAVGMLAIVLLCDVRAASATEAYIVRFRVHGKSADCHQAVWHNDVLFYNTGETPAEVKLLGVSNGTLLPAAPTMLTLPPKRVVSIDRTAGKSWDTATTASDNTWVIHIDIPSGVVVESRDEISDNRYVATSRR